MTPADRYRNNNCRPVSTVDAFTVIIYINTLRLTLLILEKISRLSIAWYYLSIWLIIISPVSHRWGHVGLPLSAQSVCRVHSICVSHSFLSVCPALSIIQASNTMRWPNTGLMLAHRLRRWPNISPVLSYGSCLVSCSMWASVTDDGPTLTQLWFKASCQYSQHEVLTRAEWILPSTGDAGPTFNRHWVVSACTRRQQQPLAYQHAAQQTRGVEPVLVWRWASDAGGRPAWRQHWTSIG